jgi:hypothetical protein
VDQERHTITMPTLSPERKGHKRADLGEVMPNEKISGGRPFGLDLLCSCSLSSAERFGVFSSQGEERSADSRRQQGNATRVVASPEEEPVGDQIDDAGDVEKGDAPGYG